MSTLGSMLTILLMSTMLTIFNYASNTGLDSLRIKIRVNCDMTKRIIIRRIKECRAIAVKSRSQTLQCIDLFYLIFAVI